MYYAFNIKKTAFTLAETLITLAIIGIVAAITIPSLMQSTQDAELKSAWKKSYATLSNATTQIVNENGGSIAGVCPTNYDHDCIRNLYKPYLKYQKVCDSSQTEGNCWSKFGNFYFWDGIQVTSSDFGGSWSSLVLNDGSFILFINNSGDCTTSTFNLERCGRISVDINGFKKPNKMGKDLFNIHLLKDKIKPYGTQGDSLEDKCEGSTGLYSGYGCATQYLYK